jgi:Icc-related predicted phosphoesterase
MTMRRFLICANLECRPKSLEWLRRLVELRRPDAILFAGGVLDVIRAHMPLPQKQRLTHDEGAFVEAFFQTLAETRAYSAVIPGPGDFPIEEFLRLGMNAEVEYPNVHLVHMTLVEESDAALCGLGGRIGHGDGLSRTLAEYHLRRIATADQPQRILLLSSPPPGVLGGSESNTVVGELIDSLHPTLCAVGGPSEQRGSRRIGHTLIINPGFLAEGFAAWVDLGKHGDEQVELLDLRKLLEPLMDIGAVD